METPRINDKPVRVAEACASEKPFCMFEIDENIQQRKYSEWPVKVAGENPVGACRKAQVHRLWVRVRRRKSRQTCRRLRPTPSVASTPTPGDRVRRRPALRGSLLESDARKAQRKHATRKVTCFLFFHVSSKRTSQSACADGRTLGRAKPPEKKIEQSEKEEYA